MNTYELLTATENPRKWKFTFESHSHIPLIRLYLSNPITKPSNECTDLKIDIFLDKSLLKVSWLEKNQSGATSTVSLRVPLPRVLIDVDSPINFRALDDHIEVKLVLVLPVDHPIISNFESVVSDGVASEDDELQPLQLDSDLNKLCSGRDVHFYCRRCSTKLTKALRFFKEMPSDNWREAADNWFGTCCCSFGGVSEKLVAKYAHSYTCTSGVCLLNATSVVLCKDDFEGYKFPYQAENQEHKFLEFSNDNLSNAVLDSGSKDIVNVNHGSQNERLHDSDNIQNGSNHECELTVDSQVSEELLDHNVSSPSMFQRLALLEAVKIPYGYGVNPENNTKDHDTECCNVHRKEEQKPRTTDVQVNKTSFLNGLLGNCFMVRSSYLSKDIKWNEISCPQCLCLLGAYPHDNIDTPVNGFNTAAPLNDGVHLFKCFLSSHLPVGGSTDLFRKYTLERMFSSQLLESAQDELSFRTVVRDLQTRSPMLQIVLVNPNSWCSFGDCIDTMVQSPKIDMYPTIKVLFSDCSNSTESELRKLEEWVTKNQVDDVYMLTSQIKDLTESLKLANSTLPASHAYLQGMPLSFLRR